MAKLILPPDSLKQLIRRRRRCRGDRYDEVWNGIYVMSPEADNEHQKVGHNLTRALEDALGNDDAIQVFHGTNVTDQLDKWTKNYRVPDVAVFLPGNPAEDRKTHWLGGPDFAVEVISRHDRSRKKFEFYAGVGVRELMLLDRRPWRLELHRSEGGTWHLAGVSEPKNTALVLSAVLPVTFRLVPGERRPRVEVARADGTQRWFA